MRYDEFNPHDVMRERVRNWYSYGIWDPYYNGVYYVTKRGRTHRGLLDMLKEWVFCPAYGVWRETELADGTTKLEISTGGWSENEYFISLLQESTFFWAICWVSSRRGGHFEFNLPKGDRNV
jgi:hypothetical protein